MNPTLNLVDSRVKTPNVVMPLFHIEFEVKIAKHSSSAE